MCDIERSCVLPLSACGHGRASADPWSRLRARVDRYVASLDVPEPEPGPPVTPHGNRDCARRGRGHHDGHAAGEQHRDAKLSEGIVAECRVRYAAGETTPALAAEFGVTQRAMWLAVTGATWRMVPMVDYAGRPDLRAYRGGANWRDFHRVTFPLLTSYSRPVVTPTLTEVCAFGTASMSGASWATASAGGRGVVYG